MQLTKGRTVISAIDFEITESCPFADGADFGDAGAYERLTGRANLAVDPAEAAQRSVVDLGLVPVDAEGLVRFEADFSILRPVEPGRGNRRIFFDYGNRGNKRALQFFNDAAPTNDPRMAEDAGNGFLMRRGY